MVKSKTSTEKELECEYISNNIERNIPSENLDNIIAFIALRKESYVINQDIRTKLDQETNSKNINIYTKFDEDIKEAIEKVKKHNTHKKNNLPLSKDI